MSVEKFLPLLDEVINRNPVAIRLNANRCLGLADDNTTLSRQTLMVAVYEWKKRVNANDDEVTTKLSEILDVNTAIENAFVEMGVNMERVDTEDNKKYYPQWVQLLFWGLAVLGLVAALVVLVRGVQKLFFQK